MQSARYSRQILMELEFSWQMLKKYSKYQNSRKFVKWERSCSIWTDGRTDRQTERHGEANGSFTQFFESSQNLIHKITVEHNYI